MKCPECGYTTFNDFSKCAKCGHDLDQGGSGSEDAGKNPFYINNEIIEDATEGSFDHNPLDPEDYDAEPRVSGGERDERSENNPAPTYTDLYKRIKKAGSGRYLDDETRIASLKLRFLAMLADIIILALSSLLVTGFGLYILGLRSEENIASLNNVILTTYLIINILLSTYFIIFPALFGNTIGKSYFGIRVVSERGYKPQATDLFFRWVGYFLSSIPLFIGFLWAFGDPLNQCWHDKLAKTIVIKEE